MELKDVIDFQLLAFDRALELYRAKYPLQRGFIFQFIGICVESSFVIVTFAENKTMEFDRQILLLSEMNMEVQEWREYISAQEELSDWKETINNKD